MIHSGPDGLVPIGRVVGLFGIKGWIKVYSYTRPPEAILRYNPWRLRWGGEWTELAVAEGRKHGRGIVARLEGYENRDRAQGLIGADIALLKSQLPPLKAGEYYWAQLEGLRVVNREGRELGTVSHLIETGANDVLAVQGERERLIPFTPGVIREVDLDEGVIRVDWEADF
jgi:16S rRNA processing protein RimM